jgi:hypothetical protein
MTANDRKPHPRGLAMKRAAVLALAAAGVAATPALAQQPGGVTAARPAVALDRTVLPIAEPAYPPITEIDARKAAWPRSHAAWV